MNKKLFYKLILQLNTLKLRLRFSAFILHNFLSNSSPENVPTTCNKNFLSKKKKKKGKKRIYFFSGNMMLHVDTILRISRILAMRKSKFEVFLPKMNISEPLDSD